MFAPTSASQLGSRALGLPLRPLLAESNGGDLKWELRVPAADLGLRAVFRASTALIFHLKAGLQVFEGPDNSRFLEGTCPILSPHEYLTSFPLAETGLPKTNTHEFDAPVVLSVALVSVCGVFTGF